MKEDRADAVGTENARIEKENIRTENKESLGARIRKFATTARVKLYLVSA